MAYALTWLPEVLGRAGLKVEEQPGWQTRGHGDMHALKGVLCHHTAGPLNGVAPSLSVVTNGRPDLAGPLSQLLLARDGTYFVIAAGLAYHAGAGSYAGVSNGNACFIGIEAENTGLENDPWPDMQMEAYRRGVAALLKQIGADHRMAIGHKEYAPRRKIDPSFDMGAFRQQVAVILEGMPAPIVILRAAPAASPTVQTILRRGAHGDLVRRLQTRLGVAADGIFGPATEAALREFQRSNNLGADGMAGPRTWSAFEAEIAAGPSDRDALLSKAAALGGNQAGRFAGRAEPLTRAGLALAAETIGVAPEVMWAVVTVETSGCGFLPDRAPVILFERHEFRRRTGGRFDATHPDISGSPGGYGAGGENQHRRLAQAVACDRRAALESASWSLGQIMGYNATTAGHSDVEELVMQFVGGEDAQLLAMARFVRNTGLHRALEQNDWAGFARGYNGPNYAANSYDTKLASAYAALCRSGLPDLDLRATQLMLTYEGFSPGSIDGRAGPRTDKAISEFRAAQGIGGSGFDSDVRRALYDRLPA